MESIFNYFDHFIREVSGLRPTLSTVSWTYGHLCVHGCWRPCSVWVHQHANTGCTWLYVGYIGWESWHWVWTGESSLSDWLQFTFAKIWAEQCFRFKMWNLLSVRFSDWWISLWLEQGRRLIFSPMVLTFSSSYMGQSPHIMPVWRTPGTRSSSCTFSSDPDITDVSLKWPTYKKVTVVQILLLLKWPTHGQEAAAPPICGTPHSQTCDFNFFNFVSNPHMRCYVMAFKEIILHFKAEYCFLNQRLSWNWVAGHCVLGSNIESILFPS